MKRKKGFTLVELLAVIVVLAIILIIAVPGVLGIIQQSKEKAQEQQREMIEETVRLYVTTDPDVVWAGENTKRTVVTLAMLQAKGYLEKKIVDPKTKREITCTKTTVIKNGHKFDYQTEFCDQVNASPRLTSNMIPIVYKDNKWVKADYTNKDNNWYDYDNQQWANMATVTESTRDAYKKADIGSEVKMSDISMMFTWIPRYKYKLWNVDGTVGATDNVNLAGDKMIDVEFETIGTTKSKGTQNGEWLTHPAFTLGGEELPGFWMAKFETGHGVATTGGEAIDNTVSPNKIVIKPSVYSWRNINMNNIFKTTTQIGAQPTLFGITTVDDIHLSRNMEWGAMAYLTNSRYGKTGNPDYTGDARKPRFNSQLNGMTGCGGVTDSAPLSEVCETYETANGQAASTTGNITGIYDTSGGLWEYVAGVMLAEDGQHVMGANSAMKQDTLDQLWKNETYLDVYAYSDTNADISRGHLGDATMELGPIISKTWYQEYSSFVASYLNLTWFIRSGSINPENNGAHAGPLAYARDSGIASSVSGYRMVLR